MNDEEQFAGGLRRFPDLLRRLSNEGDGADFIVVYAREVDEGGSFGYAATDMTTERLVYLLERAKFIALHEQEADE